MTHPSSIGASKGRERVKIFLDASAIIVFYNADDRFHPEA